MSTPEPVLLPQAPWDELIDRSRRRGETLRRRRLALRAALAVAVSMVVLAVPVGLGRIGDGEDPSAPRVRTDGDVDRSLLGPGLTPGEGTLPQTIDGPVQTERPGRGTTAGPAGSAATAGGGSPSSRDGEVEGSGRVAGSPSAGTPSAAGGTGAVRKVAFVRGDPLLLTGDLYVMAPDGTGARRVTTASGRPSWSPDGRRLLFYRSKQDAPSGDLFVVDEDGTGERRLGTGMYPDWSPDGRTIAFSDGERYDGTTFMDLWLMDADGSNPRRLTSDPAGEYMPTWSPDGRRLAYVQVQGSYAATGASSMWTVRADGTDRRKLADIGAGAIVTPTWSPDGSKVLYSCGNDLCIVAADGSSASAPFGPSGATWEYGVSWSADGATIIVQRDADGPYVGQHMSLWSMDGSGASLRQLTSGSSDDVDPAVWPRYPLSG